jgi:predicted acylesterase/phospholipase RssA
MKALLAGESPATGYTPLDPGIFTGTSAGAFNAAFMVSRPEAESRTVLAALEKLWVEQISGGTLGDNGVFRIRGNPLRYLSPRGLATNPVSPFLELAGDALFFTREGFRRGIGLLSASGGFWRRILDLFDLSEFISVAPIERNIPLIASLAGVRRSAKVLRIVATNWTTGEVAVFGNNDLTDDAGYTILLGAAAIPGLFPPHAVAGNVYVDGSLVMTTPLNPAIDAGADVLHVIYLDPDVKNIPLRRLQNTFDVLDRARVIDWASRMNEDLETAEWINRGLETLERVAAGNSPSDDEMRRFVGVAALIAGRTRQGTPYRQLTIHRYHPRDDLGGSLGVLNFDRRQITRIIARGYSDTVGHDCTASRCVIPGRGNTPR